jgi:CubicO group peptidase (beta-lactamase class C family)
LFAKELLMKKLTATVLLVIITLSLLLPGCAGEEAPTATPTLSPTPTPTPEPEPPSPSYDFSPVTTLLEDAMQRVSANGSSLLIFKDDEVIYEHYFGDYNENTVHGIASASKMMTAATIMTLVDDGLISLDDYISKYLPDFSGEKETITIRQCLSHTSGLPEDISSRWDGSITLQECVAQISQLEMKATPGAKYSYGGASLHVAAAVAEVATGKPWAELFHERMAVPLNMPDTSYPSPSIQNPSVAGGCYTKLWDYAHLCEMLLNEGIYDGKQVLSAKSVEEMFCDQTAGAEPEGAEYGLGAMRDLVDADGRATQVSSPGALGFTPWIDYNRNMYAVFMVRKKGLNDTIEELRVMVRDIVPSPYPDPEPVKELVKIPGAEDIPSGPGSAEEAQAGELFIEMISMNPDPSRSQKDVTVVFKTVPSATCYLQPINPVTGTLSRWVKEPSQVADEQGMVTWTWYIHPHVAAGEGTLQVTAELGDKKIQKDFPWINWQ